MRDCDILATASIKEAEDSFLARQVQEGVDGLDDVNRGECPAPAGKTVSRWWHPWWRLG
jgi:hypothetical protein